MKTSYAVERSGKDCANGTVQDLATLLGISRQAIYMWGETVPDSRRYELLAKWPDRFAEPQRAEQFLPDGDALPATTEAGSTPASAHDGDLQAAEA